MQTLTEIRCSVRSPWKLFLSALSFHHSIPESLRAQRHFGRFQWQSGKHSIDSVTSWALQAACWRHPFRVSENLVYDSIHGIDCNQVTNHDLFGHSPRRSPGLDDCSAQCTARLDWSHSFPPAADQHKHEHSTLGKHESDR